MRRGWRDRGAGLMTFTHATCTDAVLSGDVGWSRTTTARVTALGLPWSSPSLVSDAPLESWLSSLSLVGGGPENKPPFRHSSLARPPRRAMKRGMMLTGACDSSMRRLAVCCAGVRCGTYCGKHRRCAVHTFSPSFAAPNSVRALSASRSSLNSAGTTEKPSSLPLLSRAGKATS